MSDQPARTKSPYQRMDWLWRLMNENQRQGLAIMAGLPWGVGNKAWHEMLAPEAKALIGALRSAGVVCDIIHDDTAGVPA